MTGSKQKVVFKDSTLREGLDTPGVAFAPKEKEEIAEMLAGARVPEIEIVAPSRVVEDLEFAGRLKEKGLEIKTSGLIYAYKGDCGLEIEKAGRLLDRFDLLMPVSEKRRPKDRRVKLKDLLGALEKARDASAEVGVGFPHSTQTDEAFLVEICKKAVEKGARRVTVYDTSGGSDPFEIYRLMKRLRKEITVPLCFHGHNDLGFAGANSLAAVYAGADVLDVTVNGLGDRAGNAGLEQVAVALYLRGIETGVVLEQLRSLSGAVERASGVRVSKLAPVVGEFSFCHKSPSHLEIPGLFEAFDPALMGSERSLTES